MFYFLLQIRQGKHMGKRKLSHHVLIPGNMSSHIIFQFWKC